MTYTKDQILEAFKKADTVMAAGELRETHGQALYEAIKCSDGPDGLSAVLAMFPPRQACEAAHKTGLSIGWIARDILAVADEKTTKEEITS